MNHWLVFSILFLTFTIIDLFRTSIKRKDITFKNNLFWTVVWVLAALLFNLYVYYALGHKPAVDFLSGFIVEKSLSIDNIFLFLIIFNFFKVPTRYQYRVLMWGILGAVVLRGIFIMLGAALIHHFSWIFYIFGTFLIYTAYRIYKDSNQKNNFNESSLIRLFKKFIPVSDDYHANKLIVRIEGKILATPLMLVLISLMITDVVFAVDSIPAIFAITQDSYIVFTSNAFAMLGLQSLYFIISNLANRFAYLSHGLALILGFVGIKLIIHPFYIIDSLISLEIIVSILSTTIAISFYKTKN